MVGLKPYVIFHICEKWNSKTLFMIGFNYDKYNVINLMITNECSKWIIW
jgi:hypothetical protein